MRWMTMRSGLPVIVFFAACSTDHVKLGSSTPAEVMAVPLTAATSLIASSHPTHEDIVPPWTLTASDGSGLLLTRVDAKAVFEGPLAFTELHLYFHNPENRVREGTFQITLPQRAAVSRFAMENNGQWMEAEVVEKMVARRAYDDFLHRRQDPALLEKAAGNQFTAKVFPIAAKTDKHLVISYSQELPGTPYTLPLVGLAKTERVDVALATIGTDGKRVEQKLSERNWLPDRDFVASTPTVAGVSAGTLVAAQVTIGARAAATEKPASITLLVDTSASRALGFGTYVGKVRELVKSIAGVWGAELPIQVVAFDQDAETIYSGRAGDFGEAQATQLLARGAAGASDLGQAFAWLAQHTPKSRVVVVTDGVVTAGVEGAELQKQIKALNVDRLDVVVAGGLRDEPAMAELVRSGLPHAGTVLDLERDQVAYALGEPVRLDVDIEVPGATWIYPRSLASARAGTRTIIYARLPKPQPTLAVKLDGSVQTVKLVAGTAPLVERALASAEIADLEAALAKTPKGKDAVALRAQIAKKSIAARVISSETSMLVLETEQDYARYGIDRKALADILVVGPTGVERKGRTAPVLIAKPQVAAHDRMKPGTLGVRRPDRAASPNAVAAPADDRLLVDLEEGTMGKKESGGDADGADEEDLATVFGADASESQLQAASSSAERAETVSRLEVAVRQRRVAQERLQAVRISQEMNNPLASANVAAPSPEPQPDDRRSDSIDARRHADTDDPWPPKDAPPALTGELASITSLINARDLDGALTRAREWHGREPGNVLALIGLGEVLEARGSRVTAARVYGSIIDLFPGRADMRRFAGERLARLSSHGTDLVIDTFRRAVADRPDHLTGHRLLAYALVRAGKHAEAFDAILAGIRLYAPDRFRGGDRVLADDAAMIGAAFAAAQPTKRAWIEQQLAARHLAIATKPSTRFILYWETDANDVDFHIQDAKGNHAFYSNPQLASGGELYADVTTGYGPECFAIEGTPKAGPYRLSINYYSQGPMGYGMGLLQIQRFDGKGTITIEDRPYVIMNDHAYVDLGTVR